MPDYANEIYKVLCETIKILFAHITARALLCTDQMRLRNLILFRE